MTHFSRIGNSKFHVFTPGKHFGDRKPPRHGRNNSKKRLEFMAAAATVLQGTGGDAAPEARLSEAQAAMQLGGPVKAPPGLSMPSSGSGSLEAAAPSINVIEYEVERVFRKHGIYSSEVMDDISEALKALPPFIGGRWSY